MAEYIATTPGVHPLPDWAKQDLAELKGHQKQGLNTGDEGEEIRDVYERAREDIVSTQRAAGLDRVVEGQLRWDDMLSHVLSVNDNVETRGIVRYYDNNNFYREPVVTGDLRPSGDIAADLEATFELTDEGVQGVLPGPYSLADLATDGHYGDEQEFLAAIAEYLAGEAERFPDVETLFLLEPSVVVNEPDEAERLRDAIETVTATVDCDVVVHTYWGSVPEDVYLQLLDADVDAVGYDMVTAGDSTLSLVREHGTPDSVALGVIDGQSTRLEASGAVQESVDRFVEASASKLEEVYVTSNTELFYLPTNRFEAKLELLATATETEEVQA